jgi:hypothetical protein
VSFQLSLKTRIALLPSRSSNVGFCNAPETPKAASDGAIPRIMTFCGLGPAISKAPTTTFWPVPTKMRVLIFASLDALASRSMMSTLAIPIVPFFPLPMAE